MKLKNGIIFLVFIFLLITIIGCGRGSTTQGHHQGGVMSSEPGVKPVEQQNNDTLKMHNKHSSLFDDFAHKDIVILEQHYEPGESTKAEIEQVINTYLEVKNALFNEDIARTDKAVSAMSEKVAAVIPDKMDGKGLDAWNSHQVLYETKLKEMLHVKGLENKRSYFSHISEIMYCTIKSFGLKQGKLFAIFCNEVFDGKGAYWISDSKIIENPYLGSKVPVCREIKEEL